MSSPRSSAEGQLVTPVVASIASSAVPWWSEARKWTRRGRQHPLHRAPARRGSHVSLRHPHAHTHAHALTRALADQGVIVDMRAPDLLRFGVNALYTSHGELLTAARRLRDIVAEGAYQPAPRRVGPVT